MTTRTIISEGKLDSLKNINGYPRSRVYYKIYHEPSYIRIVVKLTNKDKDEYVKYGCIISYGAVFLPYDETDNDKIGICLDSLVNIIKSNSAYGGEYVEAYMKDDGIMRFSITYEANMNDVICDFFNNKGYCCDFILKKIDDTLINTYIVDDIMAKIISIEKKSNKMSKDAESINEQANIILKEIDTLKQAMNKLVI